VSNEDIARVVDDGSGYGVAVELLPSGAERMRQATEAHVGRPMAVLVDGRVVMAPVVPGVLKARSRP
jgi:preprotein translocase subunit SecD